jgi:flagellar biosynthesis protein FlhG
MSDKDRSTGQNVRLVSYLIDQPEFRRCHLIFDQNKEKSQPYHSSEKPEEEAKSVSAEPSAGSEDQANNLTVTVPGRPAGSDDPSMGSAAATPGDEPRLPKAPTLPLSNNQAISKFGTPPVKPIERAKSRPEPYVVRPTQTSDNAAGLSSVKPVEPARPLPAGKSSTDSLLQAILPAETSKTEPAEQAVKQTNKKIIAVGGAKGGVGKSMLSANLAVGLALLGQKVVLADLDLGGADVHLYTGVKSLTKTWNDFLDKKVDSIEDILTPTAFKGLSLIGGDSSKLGSANLPYSQKLKIMRHLKELETDFLVVDLGGDTTYNGLDFFLLADQKIVVSGIEPASVLDSYTFVKVAFIRFLERFFSEQKSLKDLAGQIRDGSLEKSENYSLEFIYQEVRNRNPKAAIELKQQFEKFRLSIVLNMTDSSKDVRIAESMQKLVKDKCFLDIGILGTIPFDKVVRKAARGFTPIVVENPKCQASRNIHQMLAAIILHREQDATRAELLQNTSRIRRAAKAQIDSGKMTLDGLTVGQINSAFKNTPRLRRSFQKILNIMSG